MMVAVVACRCLQKKEEKGDDADNNDGDDNDDDNNVDDNNNDDDDDDNNDSEGYTNHYSRQPCTLSGISYKIHSAWLEPLKAVDEDQDPANEKPDELPDFHFTSPSVGSSRV